MMFESAPALQSFSTRISTRRWRLRALEAHGVDRRQIR
jgi:hypothetical protein